MLGARRFTAKGITSHITQRQGIPSARFSMASLHTRGGDGSDEGLTDIGGGGKGGKGESVEEGVVSWRER